MSSPSRNATVPTRPPAFDAVIFDAGGILVLPDPTVLGPLLAVHGGDPGVDAHVRAHYRGMAVKSWAGSGETFWHEYNLAYCEAVGVTAGELEYAAQVLDSTRNGFLWRWPVREAIEAMRRLEARSVPMGVVSNAGGQIEDALIRAGVCQVGDGPLVSVRVVVDSHLVGVAKPDPRIFDFAVPVFEGIERGRIAFVGDSVTMDIGGASAAGLLPILLDPYDDHPDADFVRIRSLHDLVDLLEGSVESPVAG